MKPRILTYLLFGWLLNARIQFMDAAPQKWQTGLDEHMGVGDDRVNVVAKGFGQGPTDSSNEDIDASAGIERSPLQLQEEQDLERLDQLILDTLQQAMDTTQHNQPIRWIGIEEATTRLLESHSRWLILGSHWPSFVWFAMVITVILAIKKKSKLSLSSQDYHSHLLPSYSICKQKRTVD